MTELTEDRVCDQIGEDGFERLVCAFYKQVPGDEILGPMYPPDDLPGAESRLREFLIFRFGGTPRYIEQRGHPALGMRHAPFPLTHQARDRWVNLMKAALIEVNLPEDAAAILTRFFEQTATFLINRSG